VVSRSRRMQPVWRVAESREREAAQAVGKAQRLFEEESARLGELRHYRQEYQRHIEETGAAGVTAARLMELRRFLGRLGLAIEQQQGRIAAARQQLEQKRRLWREAQGRMQALESVMERYRHEEAREGARREQRETDEFAQRHGRSTGEREGYDD